MRPLRAACLALATLLALPAGQGFAQDLGQAVSPVLTLDRDRLFGETLYGQRIKATLDAENARLSAETREIEATLEAEELALTEKRAELDAAGFRELADAFDLKVQNLRNDRETAQQAFLQSYEEEQRKFFERVAPVLVELLRDMGGSMIIDRRVVMLSLEATDITSQAIQRIDAALGDGSQGE